MTRINVPLPFQYQGSKRNLAPRILDYLPRRMSRLPGPGRFRLPAPQGGEVENTG